MHPIIRELLRAQNVPVYMTVALALLGVLSGSSNFQTQIIIAILGLMAANTIIERVSFFGRMLSALHGGGGNLRLRSRMDEGFVDFHHYIEGAHDVFVAGLSLDYLCHQMAPSLTSGMLNGISFRFVMVDPMLPGDAMRKIAEHDERTHMSIADELRGEIQRCVEVLRGIKSTAGATGTITLKAGKGIPVFTVTMIDPQRQNGKIRIELRPYHRNIGPRP